MRKLYNILILLGIIVICTSLFYSPKSTETIKSGNKTQKKQNTGPVYPATKPRPFVKKALLA